ncbi:MAG TPA: BON domain-containing protein [Patescibacteria group bacterium]|nr:BON domain-containing protein [Patescibacteria group bacterium]
MEQRDDRLRLPSEDGGDLVNEPREGMTDDPTVATEEGVPYAPPTDRVMSEARGTDGPDVAGTAPTDAGELERADGIQRADGVPPRDDELAADVVAALRDSDVPAGDRIRVRASGSRVTLSGEVESVDILDEVLGIAGDVVGVDEVVDEVTVARI